MVQVFKVAVTVTRLLYKFSQFTSMLERFLSHLAAQKNVQTTLQWNGDSIPIIGMQFLKQSNNINCLNELLRVKDYDPKPCITNPKRGGLDRKEPTTQILGPINDQRGGG